MTAAAHVVQWGRTPIPFAIRRSGRKKTVSIAVEPGGDVVVTAPKATGVERLHRLVREKARWIVQHRRLTEDLEPAPAREFISGETFLYRGRQHRLVVTSHAGAPEVKLEHGRFVVRLPRSARAAARPVLVNAAMVSWYRRHAERMLPAQVAACARSLGLSSVPVQIVAQQKRWASCTSAGCVRMNWRLVQAPPRLVEYVVMHELTHLRIPSHGEAFWRALGRALPGYEMRRDELRRLGPRLTW